MQIITIYLILGVLIGSIIIYIQDLIIGETTMTYRKFNVLLITFMVIAFSWVPLLIWVLITQFGSHNARQK